MSFNNTRIERIENEIAKVKEKISEQQARLRTLEQQRTEAENLQIVQMVRSVCINRQELEAFLKNGGMFRTGRSAARRTAVSQSAAQEAQEETENED